jgi:hypothetical protein
MPAKAVVRLKDMIYIYTTANLNRKILNYRLLEPEPFRFPS